MQERWKDIPEIVGYQVSNLGRVRGIPREVQYSGGWTSRKKGKIISPGSYRGGYLHVTLGSLHKNKKVHRLVATTFIDNPDNLPIVNHKNGVRTDNRVENLEWTSHRGNIIHAIELRGQPLYIGKPIIGTKGSETVTFSSSMEAGRSGFNSSAIRNCLNGLSKTHKGYVWNWMS